MSVSPSHQGIRGPSGASMVGCRPFAAHAVNHASSQRRTSMPFIKSVSISEQLSEPWGQIFHDTSPVLGKRAGAQFC